VNLHKKCTQASDELQSTLHSVTKRRKTKEVDDECDENEQPLPHIEVKYRVLLLKYEMLLEKGASVEFSLWFPSPSAPAQLASRR
jgi:hypothetical protein